MFNRMFLVVLFILTNFVFSAVNIIPNPASIVEGSGTFTLGSGTDIYVDGTTADEKGELERIGIILKKIVESSTGESISVIKKTDSTIFFNFV